MEKIGTRDAYGKKLLDIGKKNDKVVVLDADLSGSTRTGWFRKEFSDRHINVGVAEQNLVGVSAGLAISGLIPFCSSFAMFLSGRAWEIVRNSIAYPKLNVKLVASHAGITVGEDGASHQSLEDIAIMRAIPNMVVIVPADANETSAVVDTITEYKGPCYVRCGRSNVVNFHKDDYKFEIGKGELIQSGNDITIVACGIETYEAIQAVEILEKDGYSVGLINMASIKPIDASLLIKEAKKSNLLLTVEEHNVVGGLGSAVSEVLSEEYPVKVSKMGIQDEFGQSGTSEDLMKHYHLLASDIVERAVALIKKK